MNHPAHFDTLKFWLGLVMFFALQIIALELRRIGRRLRPYKMIDGLVDALPTIAALLWIASARFWHPLPSGFLAILTGSWLWLAKGRYGSLGTAVKPVK